MKIRVFVASAVLGFLVWLPVETPTHAATRAPGAAKNIYIVVMRGAPMAAGKAADFSIGTRQLSARHDSLLASVGGARKLYSYSHALNGFAAELDKAQAQKLRADPNVISVARNEIRRLDTLTVPRFLGLTAPNGAWHQLGGGASAGDDIIVGIIDTGIWPEHPSFAPRAEHDGPASGWSGICEEGEEFPASSCNAKLIGARWFNAGFGGDEIIKALFPYEFLSPRAAEGHGVHVAGTAVGNYRVVAETGGVNLGRISGMAPAARLAVYKACWGYADDPNAGCSTVDSVAAIDQAVADGVDIINFSVDGSSTSFVDPIEFAFLIAADSGVFVATSAGNEGRQGPGTVQHIGPWVTTVGAGTHDRRYSASVMFASGKRFDGASVDDRGAGPYNVVLAADAGLAGQNPSLAALCLPGTLDATLTSGKIVVCDRGENPRLEKSHVVADVGAVGMILINTSPAPLNTDIHAVPTVQLDHVTGAAFKRFLAANPREKARLTPRQIATGSLNPAPDLLADSSLGPALAGKGNLLKPDLLAPGADILAAHSPLRTGLDYEFLTGTSMASAVVAGVAALIKQAHPQWSPAAIQSALVTTAHTRRNDGERIQEQEGNGATADPFGIGAGLIRPTKALDPGLVYDANSSDWLQFVCGAGEACFPPLGAIEPSNLNYPSIAIGELIGVRTVRRTVKNVSSRRSRYTASVKAPAGIKITLSPSAFTIDPGATRSFEVRFERVNAPLGHYGFGSIAWSDGIHQVRSPLAVLPRPLGVPAELLSHGEPIEYAVQFGYQGPFEALPRGLVPARRIEGTVADDPADDINTALATGQGAIVFPIEVPPGATYVRFALFDEDTDGDDDLDLYLFDPSNMLVASSLGNTSTEEVSISAPAPGRYSVAVHGFATEGSDARFTLSHWVLDDAAKGNMHLRAPTRAKNGQDGSITVSFSKLKTGVRYLGSIAYRGSVELPNPTIVRVDRRER